MNKQELRTQLKKHEGEELTAYYCPGGYLTVGVGHNLEANPVHELIGRDIKRKGAKISQHESDLLLDHDIDRFADEVRQEFDFFDELSNPRQHVLLDMAFNLGTQGLLKFKNMISALRESNYDRAAAEMLNSLWANQVGERSTNLAAMMRDDVLFSDLVS